MGQEPANVYGTIMSAIYRRARPDRPTIVFITGRDASGKTHFALGLAAHLAKSGRHVQLVHVDDFHHEKAIRYAGTDTEATKYYYQSFDNQLLVDRVLQPLRAAGELDVWLELIDLHTDQRILRRHLQVARNSIVIVEGVFLFRPELLPFSDVRISLQVPLHVSLARAKARDLPVFGPGIIEKHVRKYLLAQLVYEKQCKPENIADFVVENSDYESPRLITRKNALPMLREESLRNLCYSGGGRRFDAVCFDLWNTLVPLPSVLKSEAFDAAAGTLGVTPERLKPLWDRARHARETTLLTEHLAKFITEHELSSSLSVVPELMERRRSIHGRAFHAPAEDAEVVLRILRAADYQIALVSNCTSDVPDMLRRSALGGLFDVEVFSAYDGVAKPDPRIFRLTCERLGVPPTRCLYIGDGNDNELEGAAAIGMTAILVSAGETRDGGGPSIESLSALPPALL
jgi:putative hydrolase of the HAD superfamily